MKKMWVWIFDVLDDLRSDNRHSTVHENKQQHNKFRALSDNTSPSTDGLVFEGFQNFRYLGILVILKNVKCRNKIKIAAGNRCFYR